MPEDEVESTPPAGGEVGSSQRATTRSAARSPEEEARRQLLLDRVRSGLDLLPSPLRAVVEFRFGLNDGVPRSRRVIAEIIGESMEIVRQRERNGLERLRRAKPIAWGPGPGSDVKDPG